MNAMEKSAWWEVIIAVSAVVLAMALIPFLGDSASGAFGILGLLPLGVFFLRPRGNEIVVDERDREIENRARLLGISIAWMTLFTGLIVAGMWSNYAGARVLSTRFSNWLIWIQFAICYGTKGLASIVMYRRQQHAA